MLLRCAQLLDRFVTFHGRVEAGQQFQQNDPQAIHVTLGNPFRLVRCSKARNQSPPKKIIKEKPLAPHEPHASCSGEAYDRVPTPPVTCPAGMTCKALSAPLKKPLRPMNSASHIANDYQVDYTEREPNTNVCKVKLKKKRKKLDRMMKRGYTLVV